MAENTIFNSSEAIRELQKNIQSIGLGIEKCHELIEQSLTALHQDWKDFKFEEFQKDIAPKQQKIKELAEVYKKCAGTTLEEFAKIIELYERLGLR